MTGSIGDVYSGYLYQSDMSNVNASALSSKLKQANASEATDEELLDACKEFESYLIEQVMKQVQDSIPKSDEEKDNKYLDYFGDMMLQEYASVLTEQGDLGIAQKLYESMKNNARTVTIKSEKI
ncbi:MAG: rod-binding protein [Clostridium sp.]|nr:rod-binding protein [Clostridium sp.]